MIPGLRDGARSIAAKTFIDWLKQSPELKRIIKVWKVYDSPKIHVGPSVKDHMPCLRARFLSGRVERIASQGDVAEVASIITESRPQVAIELWVSGQDQADISNIADLIEDRLFPADQNDRRLLCGVFANAGIKDWMLTQEIAPPSLDAFEDVSVYAIGSYELVLVLSN